MTEGMNAIIQRGYGAPRDVLTLRRVRRPVPADDEVLVRVHAASVHPDIWHVLRGWPRVLRIMGSGLRRPKRRIPGTDMAGRVEAVGRNVTRFQPGDEVFGETNRGHQWKNGGAYAEYVTAPEGGLALKPASVSFEQAATVPTAGLIILASLRGQARVRPGQQVLVNGAAGGVGSLAVQIAKAAGAQVTAVDSAKKLGLLRSLGADHVIDYRSEDFTRGSARYDLIVDIPGNHPLSAIRRALRPKGTYVLIGHDNYGHGANLWLGSIPRMLGLTARSLWIRQLPRGGFSMPPRQDSMEQLRTLLERGQITPIIGETFPLAEAAAAIERLASGQARGRIVLTM